MLYNPGEVNVWYTVETLNNSSSNAEIFHIISNVELFPSGSKDRLSNIYSVSTNPSPGLANTATGR